jgi:hypothetical protein
MNTIFIGSTFRYSIIRAINIVTNSIPTPSARNKFPLPLHGPAAAASRSPDGVASIQPKLMSWNLTQLSDTASRYPFSSIAVMISHRLEYPSSEKKCTSSSNAVTHFVCDCMNLSHDTSGPYVYFLDLSCTMTAVISPYIIPFAND